MQTKSKITIDDVDGLKTELLEILDKVIRVAEQQQKMMEAVGHLFDAVKILKEEVQDGGQRPIKE